MTVSSQRNGSLAERQQDQKAALKPYSTISHLFSQAQSLSQVSNGLLVGGPRDCLSASLLPSADSLFCQPGLHRVESYDFWRRIGRRFEGTYQSFVDLLALGL